MTYWLLTGLSTIAAVAAFYFAHIGNRDARRCEMHANRLRASTGRITGLEGTTESLTLQVQKLRGSFYAFKAAVEDSPPERGVRSGVEPAPIAPGPTEEGYEEYPPAFCANYHQAQIDGPTSEAAACKCDYCAEMRRRRDEFRKAAGIARAKVAPSTKQ